jgi:methionyl-tRNA formyltransferase
MEIDILTTDTPHHIFFCNSLAKNYTVNIILEEPRIPSYYKTWDPLDEIFLKSDIKNLMEQNNFNEFASYNTLQKIENVNYLDKTSADISIVYGTGIIKKDLISKYTTMLNLHGGNPALYRGLDTNLWAFFHSDFENMGVALHHINPEIDTGDLIHFMKINPNSQLGDLRVNSALASYDLVKQYLEGLFDLKGLSYEPGRYYKAMPSAIKKFLREKYIESN